MSKEGESTISIIKEIVSLKSYTSLKLFLIGAFFSLGVPPIHLWFFSLICLAFFYSYLTKEFNLKFTVKALFLFFFGYFSVASYWIINSFFVVVSNQMLAFLIGIFALLLVVLAMSFVMVACLLVWVFAYSKIENKIVNALLFSTTWIIGEYLRSYFLGGQPMHYVGYMVGNIDGMIQISKYWNVHLVSFLIVITSLFTSFTWQYRGIAIMLLTTNFLIGSYSISGVEDHSNSTPINVRLVSADLSQEDLLSASGTQKVSDTLKQVSNNHKKLDLIVWPESMLQYYISGNEQAEANLKHLTDFLYPHQYLITGGPRFEVSASKHHNYFGSLFLLQADGNLIASYDKHIIVPWGEYLPFRNLVPDNLADLFSITDYTPGVGPLSLTMFDDIKFMPLLCAEGHYPRLAAEHLQDQRFIVMIGNEAWVADTTEPHQYFINAKFRAIETGLPVLLVSNKGFLAIFDANGVVQKQIYAKKAATLDGVIYVKR